MKASQVVRRVIVPAVAGLLAVGCGTTQTHSAAWKAGHHFGDLFGAQFQTYNQPASVWCQTNLQYNAWAAKYNTGKLRGDWLAGCEADLTN